MVSTDQLKTNIDFTIGKKSRMNVIVLKRTKDD